MTYISIKNRTEDERPREKMLLKGPAALADAELLAILISSGTKERSAIDLARDILSLADNSIHEMGKLSVHELQKVKGIGEARAITIAAALEIGRRRQTNEGLQRTTLISSADAAKILIPMMQDLNHEVFFAIYINRSNKILKHELVSSGGLTGTVADIRMILKNAILYNANKIILAHNHPAGSLKPSAADQELTQKFKMSAELMDIKLLDHLIIAGTNYTSMADAGMI